MLTPEREAEYRELEREHYVCCCGAYWTGNRWLNVCAPVLDADGSYSRYYRGWRTFAPPGVVAPAWPSDPESPAKAHR